MPLWRGLLNFAADSKCKPMIFKTIMCAVVVSACVFESHAIIYHCDSFDTKKKECRLVSWSGTQPSSGKVNIPESFTHDDGKVYSITSIASHALDGLTEVTEITIPASVAVIGDSEHVTVSQRSVCNFYDCPKLKMFKVSAANKVFEASGIGILCMKGGLSVLRVPQKVEVDSEARLRLESAHTVICDDAFHGNTTVEILSIDTYTTVNGNGGLNFAKNLRKYEVRGNYGWLTKSGGLLVETETYAVSWPPALETDEVKVPSGIEVIRDYAFANTRVRQVKMSAVRSIREGAFRNSAIETVSIPGSVSGLYKSVFEDCSGLVSIEMESVKLRLPESFARNCKSLERVTSENPIYSIGEAAFKGCSSLVEFPFSGITVCDDDSIFYGCGFKEVVYEESPVYDFCTYGKNFLGLCRSLERIDASRLETSFDNLYSIGPDFAPLCPNLREIRFPAFSSFWQYYGAPSQSAFGYTCALEKIVLHTFWNDGIRQFCYSTVNGVNDFYPKVYVAVTANREVCADRWNEWPVSDLFSADNGARVHPQFYCDAYKPGESYVDPDGTYYVPGGAKVNYSEAGKAGCDVREMFSVAFNTIDDRMRVSVGYGGLDGAMTPESVRIRFDDEPYQPVSFPGYMISGKKMSEISRVGIAYVVDGVEMLTEYPYDHWNGSSVSEISVDSERVECRIEGGVLRLNRSVDRFEIYSADGSMLQSCVGDSADVSMLVPGIYIIRIDGSSRSIKISL